MEFMSQVWWMEVSWNHTMMAITSLARIALRMKKKEAKRWKLFFRTYVVEPAESASPKVESAKKSGNNMLAKIKVQISHKYWGGYES